MRAVATKYIWTEPAIDGYTNLGTGAPHITDVQYAEYFGKFHDALVGPGGLTVDATVTGQYDFESPTAAPGTASLLHGFRNYVTSDTHDPLYIRVEFWSCARANSTSLSHQPEFRISVGTARNGSGVITSGLVSVDTINPIGPIGSQTTNSYAASRMSAICSGPGYFWIFFQEDLRLLSTNTTTTANSINSTWPSAPAAFFGIERMRRSDGNFDKNNYIFFGINLNIYTATNGYSRSTSAGSFRDSVNHYVVVNSKPYRVTTLVSAPFSNIGAVAGPQYVYPAYYPATDGTVQKSKAFAAAKTFMFESGTSFVSEVTGEESEFMSFGAGVGPAIPVHINSGPYPVVPIAIWEGVEYEP